MTGTTIEFNKVESEEVLDIHLSPYHTKIFEMLITNLELCGSTLIDRLIVNEWARQQERAKKQWEIEPND